MKVRYLKLQILFLHIRNGFGRSRSPAYAKGRPWCPVEDKCLNVFVGLKGNVNPKIAHFLFTQLFRIYFKYTKGKIRFFSKVRFHFLKAPPNSKHLPLKTARHPGRKWTGHLEITQTELVSGTINTPACLGQIARN